MSSKKNTAKLTLPNEKTIELPILKGTVGPDVIDITDLYNKANVFTFDPGFGATGSCISQLTYIDGDEGILLHRGYSIEDLAEKSDFLEVAYLLLNGELPNKKQLKQFEKQERKERKLSKTMLEDIKRFPKKAHPMDVARTAVSIMGLEDKETKDNSSKANMRKVMRIFAKTPVALAAFYRTRKGKKIIPPKNNLSFSENFFHMCFGKVPNKDIVKAFDVSLILYAEHSFNVSTFTARTITSSLSDIHGAITGAIASLKGPLHGGANEEVMHMMNKIKKPENALKWINKALDNKDCLLYTSPSPRDRQKSRMPSSA